MGDQTAIEWADATFNPWIGCTKVSPACDHCYAAVSTPARTLGVSWGAGQARRRTSAANWKLPLRWNAKRFMACGACGWRGECDAELIGCGRCGSMDVDDTRRRVFCASLADVFDNEVDPLWRRDLFELILKTPNLDWLLLTKRIGNAGRLIEEQRLRHARYFDEWAFSEGWLKGEPPANVWLGATVCNQEEADRDIPKLLALPARVHFVSMEPLLGHVDLEHACGLGRGIPSWDDSADVAADAMALRYGDTSRLDWVIVGGESGPGARPMHPDWVRSLRDQCAAASVPFLFKQWGAWAPDDGRHSERMFVYRSGMSDIPDFRVPDPANDGETEMAPVGKRKAGRMLDGLHHDGFPS
ncbi:phage Gp37/Gp68 family protein [Luteibacter yeojuensis]|uniref:Phage Gp37/Gp68 family protein n=1 Tax=Luteibacter yeojuensis TaxID=345309 RepID=A0A7X5QT99_9GAMM|nr:phage Gp37/Gp68 family protein [Luteibacter yeojuensis]NID15021.1 phage Gp37/Gp68 family protein [Luteibacter yeojuensis]